MCLIKELYKSMKSPLILVVWVISIHFPEQFVEHHSEFTVQGVLRCL